MLQLGLGLRLGPGNGILSLFFFFSLSVNVVDIVCCALLACIVGVIRHMTSSGMQRGEQSGSRSATARLGVRDFEIHWISRGFRISEWISGFHSGFLNFSLDFCRQVSSCMFLDILVIVPSLAKIFS